MVLKMWAGTGTRYLRWSVRFFLVHCGGTCRSSSMLFWDIASVQSLSYRKCWQNFCYNVATNNFSYLHQSKYCIEYLNFFFVRKMEIRKNIMSYAVYCLYGSTAKVHTSQKYFPCVHTPKEGVASLTAFLRSSDRNVSIHKSQTSIRTSTVFTFNLALLWKLCSILNILATCHSSWIWESIPAVDVFLLFCLCWRQSQEAGHAKKNVMMDSTSVIWNWNTTQDMYSFRACGTSRCAMG